MADNLVLIHVMRAASGISNLFIAQTVWPRNKRISGEQKCYAWVFCWIDPGTIKVRELSGCLRDLRTDSRRICDTLTLIHFEAIPSNAC